MQMKHFWTIIAAKVFTWVVKRYFCQVSRHGHKWRLWENLYCVNLLTVTLPRLINVNPIALLRISILQCPEMFHLLAENTRVLLSPQRRACYSFFIDFLIKRSNIIYLISISSYVTLILIVEKGIHLPIFGT